MLASLLQPIRLTGDLARGSGAGTTCTRQGWDGESPAAGTARRSFTRSGRMRMCCRVRRWLGYWSRSRPPWFERSSEGDGEPILECRVRSKRNPLADVDPGDGVAGQGEPEGVGQMPRGEPVGDLVSSTGGVGADQHFPPDPPPLASEGNCRNASRITAR